MCEVGIGEGRGVGFYHVETIAFWLKNFIRKAGGSSKYAGCSEVALWV